MQIMRETRRPKGLLAFGTTSGALRQVAFWNIDAGRHRDFLDGSNGTTWGYVIPPTP